MGVAAGGRENRTAGLDVPHQRSLIEHFVLAVDIYGMNRCDGFGDRWRARKREVVMAEGKSQLKARNPLRAHEQAAVDGLMLFAVLIVLRRLHVHSPRFTICRAPEHS